jgi:Arc/MetJ family transcription regulator
LEAGVRTNIDIDQDLLDKVMEVTEIKTKKAAVEEGLRTLLRLRMQRKSFDELKGLGWEGDLDEMRLGWGPPQDLE